MRQAYDYWQDQPGSSTDEAAGSFWQEARCTPLARGPLAAELATSGTPPSHRVATRDQLFLGHSRTSPLPSRLCRGRLLHSGCQQTLRSPDMAGGGVATSNADNNLAPRIDTPAAAVLPRCSQEQQPITRTATTPVRLTCTGFGAWLPPRTLPRPFPGLPRCHRQLHDNSATIVACAQHLRGHHGSQRLLQLWRGFLPHWSSQGRSPTRHLLGADVHYSQERTLQHSVSRSTSPWGTHSPLFFPGASVYPSQHFQPAPPPY